MKEFAIFTSKRLLNPVALFCLLAIFIYGCYRIFFSIYVSSDVFIEEIWSRAILERGLSAWYDLLFTFSPAYFPDFLGYFLAKVLFHASPIKTVYLATLFQVLCFLLSVFSVLFSLDLTKKTSFIGALWITTVLLLLSAYFPGMWLWYYSTNDNLSATILGFYCLALTLSIFKSLETKRLLSLLKIVFLFALCSFSIINGRLFVLAYLAPAIFALFLIFVFGLLRRNAVLSVRTISVIVILLLSYLFAVDLFEPFVNPFSTLANKLNSAIPIQDSFYNVYSLFKIALFNDTIVTKWMVVFWLFIALYTMCCALNFIFQYHRKNNQPIFLLVFHVFFVVAIGANFLGPIVSGLLALGLPSFRYFSTLFILPVVFFIYSCFDARAATGIKYLPMLSEHCLLPRLQQAGQFIVKFFGCSLLLALAFLLHQKPTATASQILQLEPSSQGAKLAACIDRYAAQYHLHLGVSDYWNSYGVALFSNKNIWIDPICNNLEPCVVLDRGHFVSFITGSNRYDFLLVSNNDQFAFSKISLDKVTPSPDVVLDCFDHIQLYIYNQSKPLFNSVLKAKIKKHLFTFKQIKKFNIANNEWIRLSGDWKSGLEPVLYETSPIGWAFGAFRSGLPVGRYPPVSGKMSRLN